MRLKEASELVRSMAPVTRFADCHGGTSEEGTGSKEYCTLSQDHPYVHRLNAVQFRVVLANEHDGRTSREEVSKDGKLMILLVIHALSTSASSQSPLAVQPSFHI